MRVGGRVGLVGEEGWVGEERTGMHSQVGRTS